MVTGQAQNPPSSILGKTDLQALLEAAPAVPDNTSEAATRAYGPDVRNYHVQTKLGEAYRPFFQQATAAHTRLNDAINTRRKDMPDQATLEKQAKEQSNASPIIAGMGGVDNIQRMTPEQREQAARQSVAAYQQKLASDAGRNSPGTQAFMQKVMTDPEYRARFQKMSKQEQEAEIRKFMGAPPASAGPSEPASEGPPVGNELATAMAIRSDLQKMLAKIREIDAEFTSKEQAILATQGSHQEIEREIKAKIEKVPFVSLGEAGHHRDPQRVTALHKEQATRNRDRANWELHQRSALYNQRKTRYKELVSEYQSWLKQNLTRINTSMATPLKNTNTELEVAGYEDGLIALSENLARYSQETTKDAALYEKLYHEAMSNPSAARPAQQ